MKIRVVILFLFIFFVSRLPSGLANDVFDYLNIGDPMETANVTNNKVMINGQIIPAYNVQGHTVVVLDDLNYYGFDINWDGELKTMEIVRNPKKAITPIDRVYDKPRQIIYSDVIAYIGNTQQVVTYNIDGSAAIYFDDLVVFGKLSWDEQKRIAAINLSNTVPEEKIPAKVRGKKFINLDRRKDCIDTFAYTDVYYQGDQFVYHDNFAIADNKSSNIVNHAIEFKKDNGIYIGTLLHKYSKENFREKQNFINENYGKQREYLASQKYKDYVSMIFEGIDQKRQQEYVENNYIPLKLHKVRNTFYDAEVILKNIGDKPIKEFQADISCYTKSGELVTTIQTTYKAKNKNEFLYPSYTSGYTCRVNGRMGTSEINVDVISVRFDDDSEWKK
jgi:hypothetical protein